MYRSFDNARRGCFSYQHEDRCSNLYVNHIYKEGTRYVIEEEDIFNGNKGASLTFHNVWQPTNIDMEVLITLNSVHVNHHFVS